MNTFIRFRTARECWVNQIGSDGFIKKKKNWNPSKFSSVLEMFNLQRLYRNVNHSNNQMILQQVLDQDNKKKISQK